MKCCIRRKWVAVLLAGLAALCAVVVLTRHHIDETHFQMIEKGMTLAQVETIFRAKPGNYDWAEPQCDSIWLDLALVNALDSSTNSPKFVSVTAANINGSIDLLDDLGVLNRILWKQSKTWTSRHGSFEIQFDHNERVSAMFLHRDVRIVWPWQRAWQWWKAK